MQKGGVMRGNKYHVRGLVIVASLLLFPRTASAQSGAFAGTVKDPSGAVLPGVTVEAMSPALIEKVRTATSDGQGQYAILDLRPGVYSVTFTLTGFKIVTRGGLELSAGITLNVSADMEVGAVEETLTVTGQTPMVDTQTTVHRQVVTRDIIDALPIGKTQASFAQLIPGMKGFSNGNAGHDVGNNQTDMARIQSIHGSRGAESWNLFDGLRFLNPRNEGGGAAVSWNVNMAIVQEVVVDIDAPSAEALVGAPRVNAIPRDGGNTFQGIVFGNFTKDALQGNNITPTLQARGTSIAKIDLNSALSLTLGGPLLRDKLWFIGAVSHTAIRQYPPGVYYAKDPLAYTYTPDLSRPALDDNHFLLADVRMTWQATRRNKFGFYANKEWLCACTFQLSANVAPEASILEEFEPLNMGSSPK
jgi:hypothetical protein